MRLRVDSWDSAIKKGKLKIRELKAAINAFEAMRDSGEPWPTESTDQGSEPANVVKTVPLAGHTIDSGSVTHLISTPQCRLVARFRHPWPFFPTLV
jgi:hypothetical protein